MPAQHVIHLTGGAVAIVAGFTALFSAKGAPLHRRVGMAFVYAMAVLTITGVIMAAHKGDVGTMVGGSLAAYLVITGLITVRPATPGWRRALMVAAGLGGLIVAVSLVRAAKFITRPDAVAFYLVFAAVAVLAVWGDVRVLRGAVLQGAPRLRRHLWRLCIGLWIATASFFLGPRRRVEMVLPDWMVTKPTLAAPVVLVIVMMLYWLWRLRTRVPVRR